MAVTKLTAIYVNNEGKIIEREIPGMNPYKIAEKFAIMLNDPEEIADVWIRWAGKQRIFSTEELDKLFLKLKTIKINFNDLSATDTSYCQYLSFGILKKDWEYILNSTKWE